MLVPERVAATREARIAPANPDGAAALRDWNTYDALASAATGLLHDLLPSHSESAPAA